MLTKRITETTENPTEIQMSTNRGFWVSIFTDEGWDFDPIILSILVAVAFSIVLQSYAVFKRDKEFDPERFGNGIAYILGAGGVGYGAKRFGEKHNRGEKDGSTDSN